MASLMPSGKQQYFDGNGNPLSGGRLYTYISGTSTPLATYSDQAGAVPNANPVVLNARGEATIFWGSAAYKAVLKDASDVEIWTQDNLQALVGVADLASTAATKGAALVGFDGGTLAAYIKNKSAQVVDSITALKAIDKTKFIRAFATGYYAAGDGGGGDFWHDSSDTTSADNGGTVIVATDGARWKRTETKTVNPREFGAVGDGTTDDLTACQAAADRADAVGGTLVFPAGYTFALSEYLRIKPGVRAVLGMGGVIKFIGAALNAGVFAPGIKGGYASNSTDLTIDGLIIDCNNRAVSTDAIMCWNVSRCRITNNVIKNGKNGYGILLLSHTDGAVMSGNIISGNVISGETGVSTTTWQGIAVRAEPNFTAPHTNAVDHWKALFTAAGPVFPTTHNTIVGNTVIGGYYGVWLSGAQWSNVSGNSLSSNVRGVSVQDACIGNVVSGNTISENESSGIHLAYGCLDNLIKANDIYTTRGAGEGMLQAYVGCQRNKFAGNTVNVAGASTSQYHCYTAVHCDFNEFSSNTLHGNASKAYIAVESAWDNTVANAAHRANGLGAEVNSFANAGSTAIVVKNNTINAASAVPALFLSQISDGGGNYALSGVRVDGNAVLTNTPSKQLELLEENSGSLSGIVARGNTFNISAAAAKFTLPRGREHFVQWGGNERLDENKVNYQFTSLDTTPDVSIGNRFECVNGGATSITMFDGGTDGQEFQLRLDSNTTIVHNNAAIRCRGNVNIATPGSNAFVSFRRMSGIWFEIWRNF